MVRTFLVSLLVAVPAFAQDKPAKTYPPDEAVMKQIREKHKVLTDAIAKLPDSPFKPDVEVYAKAVEWVTRHGEYWDAKSGEKILAVLATGQERAEELITIKVDDTTWFKEGELPSWLKVRGKPVVCGYRSHVDKSVQPYSVTFPIEYDSKDKWRLDVVLHGRDSVLTEVKFIHGKEITKPTTEPVPYVQIEVYGRGNNAYRWSGETDVMQVIYGTLYPHRGMSKTDYHQKILRGFSMGGAGAWHIGLHRPFDFRAIGPGAGFSVTKGYVRNLPDPLPDYVERCLRIYDAADYAENAFHVPVIAYAGDKDPQQAAARNVQERLKRYPDIPPITLIAGKDLEHKMPPEYMAKAEEQYQVHTRQPLRFQDKIRFVTYTTRYREANWLSVVALDKHFEKAMIEADWTRKKTTIRTENVRALFLRSDGRTSPSDEVVVNGQLVKLKPQEENRLGVVFLLVRQSGKWGEESSNEWHKTLALKPQKVNEQQGPIDDAFMSKFVVVNPSGDGWNSDGDRFLSASSKQFAHVWDKYFRGKVSVITAQEFKPEELFAHLVLFGDPQSNPLIAKVLPKLPITWTKDKLVVNGKSYDPATHVPVMIYPNPLSPGKYVVLNTGHTFSEKDLQGTNALLYPHLGDWAVIKPKPTAKEPWAYEVVDAGLFDEFWQFEKK